MTVILPSGEIVELGSTVGERDGYDLRGAFIGPQGCFGLALDITVKLTPKPRAVRTVVADFTYVDQPAHVTAAIVGAGLVAAALELIDGGTLGGGQDPIDRTAY